MPKVPDYPEDTPVSADKFLFNKASGNVTKTVTLANLATAIKNLIASFFTSSTVVPSTAPTGGQVLVGNAGGTAYVPKTLTGDVTLSSTGATAIATGAVTPSKMETVAASKLFGRGSAAGTGVLQPITLGTGLSMSDTTLNVSAGTGNVTQSADASEANHVFVSGGADKSRVETTVEIDPGTGDMTGIGDMTADTVTTPELAISATHSTDDTYHGIVISGLNAGATIAQWEVVYLGGASKWLLADADGSGTYPARGLAVAAYVDTDPAKVLTEGTVRNDAWAWTIGGDIYLSTTIGGLTQTPPATPGDAIQRVGFAVTADIAYFNFGQADYTIV